MKMEKIDKYTFKVSFAKPYATFIETLIRTFPPTMYAPKHYLKKFHPKYTSMDEIKKEIKKEGFDTWIDLFQAKNTDYDNPDLPVITAWKTQNRFGVPIQTWVRNPYYWKVDTEGNQLPYIDKIERTLLSDREAILLRCLAGDADFQRRGVSSIDNYPIVMQNREKGNYRVVLDLNPGTNYGTIFFNFFHKDPVLRKLFRDKQFRVALSIAINRDEINELLFKGLATPSQVAPIKGTPWYEERFCKVYTEYDPKKANELLDKIGLAKRDTEGYRLCSDGKRLKFVMNVDTPWPPQDVEIAELVKGYWKKVGIQVVVKPLAGSLWVTRNQAAEYDVSMYAGNAGFADYAPVTRNEVIPLSTYAHWAPLWGLWVSTNGKSGEEPPAEVKRLVEIYKAIPEELSSEKRIALNKEALEIHAKNLWMIGIVAEPDSGRFIVVKNNFRNVPKSFHGTAELSTVYTAQYFIKK